MKVENHTQNNCNRSFLSGFFNSIDPFQHQKPLALLGTLIFLESESSELKLYSSLLFSLMTNHTRPRQRLQIPSWFPSLQSFQVNSMRSYYATLLFKNHLWLLHCLQVNPVSAPRRLLRAMNVCYLDYFCHNLYLQFVFL